MLPNQQRDEAREILSRDLPWQKARSSRYRTCPHEYIISDWTGSKDCRQAWQKLALIIEACGEYRTWRYHRIKFLSLDGLIYWLDPPALNRTGEHALDNGGFPDREALNAIQDRFWSGTKARANQISKLRPA